MGEDRKWRPHVQSREFDVVGASQALPQAPSRRRWKGRRAGVERMETMGRIVMCGFLPLLSCPSPLLLSLSPRIRCDQQRAAPNGKCLGDLHRQMVLWRQRIDCASGMPNESIRTLDSSGAASWCRRSPEELASPKAQSFRLFGPTAVLAPGPPETLSSSLVEAGTKLTKESLVRDALSAVCSPVALFAVSWLLPSEVGPWPYLLPRSSPRGTRLSSMGRLGSHV